MEHNTMYTVHIKVPAALILLLKLRWYSPHLPTSTSFSCKEGHSMKNILFNFDKCCVHLSLPICNL